MLPEGWKRSTVGDACAIKNNLRFPISKTQRELMQGEYPYFGPTGVLGYLDHYRIDEEIALIGEDGDHFLKFRDREMTTLVRGKSNVNNHAHVIADSTLCLAQWFHYWFMHHDITTVLSRQGVGRYKLTKAGLENLEILLPPVVEQRRLTTILSTWDEAIAATEKLLANSRKQKRALMQGLIVRRSRSATTWRHCHLREVASRIQRDSDGNKHPVLMISSGSGFVRQDEKYSRFMAGKSLDDYILLKKGEFAYNKGNSKLYEFGCVFPLEGYAQGLVPHVYVCFSLSDECDPTFFKHLFEADYLHDQLGALVNTGVRNNGLLNIRPADFMNVRIPVPPMEEQRAIAKVLDVATTEIALRERELATLQQQKRALMQQLLTGKRRVHIHAAEAAP